MLNFSGNTPRLTSLICHSSVGWSLQSSRQARINNLALSIQLIKLILSKQEIDFIKKPEIAQLYLESQEVAR